jgi:four helix bundle suffix protein
VEQNSPEVAAKIMICLIHQANFLLAQQLRALDKKFLHKVGFTERLSRTRLQMRMK